MKSNNVPLLDDSPSYSKPQGEHAVSQGLFIFLTLARFSKHPFRNFLEMAELGPALIEINLLIFADS